jgi:hypothetical protein
MLKTRRKIDVRYQIPDNFNGRTDGGGNLNNWSIV